MKERDRFSAFAYARRHLAWVLGLGFFSAALHAETLQAPTRSAQKASRLQRVVHRMGRRYHLSPALIFSVIRVESEFNREAVSPRGAMGLMQIMPETGEWLARRCGMWWAGPEMLLDEETNVMLGVTYLAMLRDRYGGDLKKALSAYNRGPAKVDGDLAEGKGLMLAYYNKVREFLSD